MVMKDIWEDTQMSPADTANLHKGLEYPRMLVSVVEPGTNRHMDTKDVMVTRYDNFQCVLSFGHNRESPP